MGSARSVRGLQDFSRDCLLQPKLQWYYRPLVSKSRKIQRPSAAHFCAMHAFAAMIGLGMLLASGCGKPRMVGVVQSCKLAQNGYELSIGTSNSTDYALVQIRALLDAQGKIAIQRDGNAIATLGNRFVGKRVCFYGDVQRDQHGRRFILVRERNQIQVLR